MLISYAPDVSKFDNGIVIVALFAAIDASSAPTDVTLLPSLLSIIFLPAIPVISLFVNVIITSTSLVMLPLSDPSDMLSLPVLTSSPEVTGGVMSFVTVQL